MKFTTGGDSLKYSVIDIDPTIPLGLIFPHEVFYIDLPSLASENGVDVIVDRMESLYVQRELQRAQAYSEFCGAKATTNLGDGDLTAIIVHQRERHRAASLRSKVILRSRIVKLVSHTWILDCWREGTRIPEDVYKISI
jgi:hypothetical protein